MTRLLFFLLLIYTASAIESCIIQEKGKPDIQVIQLDDDDSEESEEMEILALHLPDRRKREVDNQGRSKHFCNTDEDCGPGKVCVAHLTCVKGTWRTLDSQEFSANFDQKSSNARGDNDNYAQ